MGKIYAYIPSTCHYKAVIEKPEEWEDMGDSEKKEYFLDNMEREASLCHQCSREVESDLEPAEDVYSDKFELHYDEDGYE